MQQLGCISCTPRFVGAANRSRMRAVGRVVIELYKDVAPLVSLPLGIALDLEVHP
jgi:hypothetical protein